MRASLKLAGPRWPRSFDELRFRNVALVVIVVLTIFGYVDVGPHGRIDPKRIDLHKTDFTVYTEAGAAFFDGRDPYRVTNPRGWHYLYPPLFALVVAPLNVFDTETQVVVWYVVSIAVGFGCYRESLLIWRLLAGNRPVSPERTTLGLRFSHAIGIAAFLAVMLPALDCLQRGQLGIVVLYLLMLGFRLTLEPHSWRRLFLGGVILSLPVSVKLVPLLPVGFLICQRAVSVRYRALPRRRILAMLGLPAGVAAGGVLFLLVIPTALVGWTKNEQSLKRWMVSVVSNEHVGSSANFDVHSPRNQSLANAVFLLHDSLERFGYTARRIQAPGVPAGRIAHRPVLIVVGASLALLALLGLTVGRSGDPLGPAVTYALACWATLLVSPLSWGHYFMIELPALITVPLWLHRRGWSRMAVVLAVVPAVLSWLHYVGLRFIGQWGLLGFGTTAWYFIATVVLLASLLRSRNADEQPRPAPRTARRVNQLAAVGETA